MTPPGNSPAGLGSPSLGRPKGSLAAINGKYGRCPTCGTGRRIRTKCRLNPLSPVSGKYRFVCSTRGNDDNACFYSELLDSDPADNPAAFSGAAVQSPVVAGGGGGGDGNTTIAGQGLTASANMGNDKTEPKLGCPQCMVGRLTKKCRDTFNWKETMLVCDKVRVGKEMVGGCGYKMQIDSDAADDGAKTKADEKKKDGGHTKPDKKALEKLAAEDRAKGLNDPNAAAVLAAPGKKIVVDLTEDNELLGIPAPRAPPASSMVGAHAPIVIRDDSEAAAEFDNLDSADELELIQLADQTKAK
ncbi:hypothetical protein C8A00DRAFT_13647 [Chaetomidium leptoderma]|uniref:Uncharacterized protein n=1 Tax=Chaetomidium leptoderma TaxID=669021 RepID=A0AAN7A039_9PEZI|nr:hypothetical protein C8A00DRAFT_13647 [Chaetomidium leptoderma]